MANIGRIIRFDIDLSLPLKQVHASPMIEGDRLADVIEIMLNNRGEAVDPSGLIAVANAELSGQDGVTVRNPGTVSGGKITIPLQAECYAVPGSIRITVTLTAGSTTRTVLSITGYVEQKGTGVIIDPTGSIPSYDDIVQIINELEAAKQAATTATTAANNAANNANLKADVANTAAQTANNAADAAADAAQHGEAVAKRLDVVQVAVEVLPPDADAYGAAEQTDSSTLLRVGIPQLPVRNATLHMDDGARQVLQRTPTHAEIVTSWRVDPVTTQLYKRIHGY